LGGVSLDVYLRQLLRVLEVCVYYRASLDGVGVLAEGALGFEVLNHDFRGLLLFVNYRLVSLNSWCSELLLALNSRKNPKWIPLGFLSSLLLRLLLVLIQTAIEQPKSYVVTGISLPPILKNRALGLLCCLFAKLLKDLYYFFL